MCLSVPSEMETSNGRGRGKDRGMEGIREAAQLSQHAKFLFFFLGLFCILASVSMCSEGSDVVNITSAGNFFGFFSYYLSLIAKSSAAAWEGGEV